MLIFFLKKSLFCGFVVLLSCCLGVLWSCCLVALSFGYFVVLLFDYLTINQITKQPDNKLSPPQRSKL